MQSRDVTIVNKLGLHARAASKFVNVAKAHASSITIAKDGQEVDGKSIMSVMLLAATLGSQLTLSTDGTDEDEAMRALVELIEGRFGEGE
jgi:phosphocarrier protein